MHDSLAEAVVAVLSGTGALPRYAETPLGERTELPSHAEANAPPHGVATPPLDGVWRIVARLEAAGITCALGGSGLLAAFGLTDRVRDWDLTTDAPRAEVEGALAGLEWRHTGSDALHADEKLMLDAFELEIIRGFAFFTPAGVVRIPTIVTRRWAGIPVGDPACWASAYHLLERFPKRDALLGWLRAHGANHAALEALESQPLPDSLAALLGALPIATP